MTLLTVHALPSMLAFADEPACMGYGRSAQHSFVSDSHRFRFF